jgi:hypothetical protein
VTRHIEPSATGREPASGTIRTPSSTTWSVALHDAGFEGPDGTSYISLALYPQKPL